jgi:hypothetical protein
MPGVERQGKRKIGSRVNPAMIAPPRRCEQFLNAAW